MARKHEEYSLNLSPHPQTISLAFRDLILRYGWRMVTIMYEDSEALIRLQPLLKLPTDSDVKIIVKQLDFSDKQKNM